MNDSLNQQTSTEIPYYTHWTIALNVLSLIIFILSCIVIRTTDKETKAELLISHIILSSCMFIGTILFFIKTVIQCLDKTVNDKPKGLLATYIIILIFSTVNLVISGIMLDKLEKEEEEEEEEEEEIKNYSGALIFLSFLFLVLYVLATIFEYKKEKEYVYQPSEAIKNKVADRYERYRLHNMIKKNIIQNTPDGSTLSRNDLNQLVRTKMDRYDAIKEDITSKDEYREYPPNVLRSAVLAKLERQQREKLQIRR